MLCFRSIGFQPVPKDRLKSIVSWLHTPENPQNPVHPDADNQHLISLSTSCVSR